jgi:hypothetical protein
VCQGRPAIRQAFSPLDRQHCAPRSLRARHCPRNNPPSLAAVKDIVGRGIQLILSLRDGEGEGPFAGKRHSTAGVAAGRARSRLRHAQRSLPPQRRGGGRLSWRPRRRAPGNVHMANRPALVASTLAQTFAT